MFIIKAKLISLNFKYVPAVDRLPVNMSDVSL